MSSTIVPFLDGASFDPQHVEAMGHAFDKAAKDLHDRGQPALVREIIATGYRSRSCCAAARN